MFLGKQRAVPYKGKFVMQTKISIDLYPDPEGSSLIKTRVLDEIVRGCLYTLIQLGEFGKMVEAIRVTWVKYDDQDNPGPMFSFHFSNPAGLKSGFSADYRFIGEQKCNPLAVQIVEYFCGPDCLPLYISEHIQQSRAKLNAILNRLPRPLQPTAGS